MQRKGKRLGWLALARASAARASSTVSVSFIRGEQLVHIRRPGSTPTEAVRRLLAGLTRSELAQSYRTYIPAGTTVRLATS